jgi:excisionase family DNA binding protein
MSVAAPVRPETIAIQDVAERLDVHENTVRNWADRGVLQAYRTPTGRRKVLLSDVERLEREMYGAPTSPVELTATTPVPAQSDQLEQASQMP